MIDVVETPGKEKFSPAKQLDLVMAEYMSKHDDFYLFSPDETTSNKLDAVFEVSSRAWDLPKQGFDLPESPDGRIIEMLSENALFACMVGHLASGGHAVMTSYEAFFAIITSQLLQQIKFLEQSAKVKWRPEYPAVNLLSTSTCWRQDHNGFTHQSPALISTLLSLPSKRVNCLFPLDDVATESAFIYMMRSTNVVNLTTFNKNEQPRWLDSHQADAEYSQGGASILEFASDKDPDYILAAAGDIVSCEAIRAAEILRKDLPEKKFRVVNIAALSYNAIGTTDNQLSQVEFDKLFTSDKPIIANFHGYPATLKQILTEYASIKRLFVHGFLERGSTTTPFEMLSINEASRYHLAMEVAKLEKRQDLVDKYQKNLGENSKHAREFGVDKFEL